MTRALFLLVIILSMTALSGVDMLARQAILLSGYADLADRQTTMIAQQTETMGALAASCFAAPPALYPEPPISFEVAP